MEPKRRMSAYADPMSSTRSHPSRNMPPTVTPTPQPPSAGLPTSSTSTPLLPFSVYPPPSPPPLLTKQPASASELSTEELRVIWSDRIKLLAHSVTTRHLFEKIKDDIKNHESLKASSLYLSLPEDGRRQVDTELTKLASKRDETKKKLDDSISQLTRTNNWPVSPPTETEEGQADNQREVMKYIQELKEMASKMKEGLRERKTSADTSAMEVDPQGSSRSLKRRRLSDGELLIHGSTADEFDIDAIREKIGRLEGMFSTFENDLVARDAELRDEFEERIDNKFEQMIPQISATTSTMPSDDRFQEVRENIEVTGNQVEELAVEIGKLILQSSSQETDLKEVRRKLEESNQIHAELQQQLQRYIDTRETDLSRISALEKALDLYVANPPTGSASLRPTQDHLLHYIQDPVMDMVHANIQPLIEDLRAQVQEMLRTHSQEMYKTLWGKLSLTLQMVETISQRIEQDGKGD